MFNKLLILSVLSLCGMSLSAPAQRIGFHFGKGGIHVTASADFGHEYGRYGHHGRRSRARSRRGRRHYDRHRSRNWVEGYYREVHVPARYGWIDDCGRRVWAEIAPARYARVWVPGRYSYR